jgi:hypothetical protein
MAATSASRLVATGELRRVKRGAARQTQLVRGYTLRCATRLCVIIVISSSSAQTSLQFVYPMRTGI